MKKVIISTILSIMLFGIVDSTKAQFSYMGSYNWEGVPNYLVTPSDVIDSSFLNNLSATLPESRSVPIYEPQLLAKSVPSTISLSATADVWVTFIKKGGWYRSGLAYYTYPTNAPLTAAPANKDLTVIFPNCSTPGFGGYLQPGNKAYLGKFPANTTIAFALVANGWNDSKDTNSLYILYANPAFNPEPVDSLKKHVIVINDSASGRLVVGFEDTRRDKGSDNDFNDVMFYSTVVANNAVANRDSFPKMLPDGKVVFSGNTGGLESKSLGDIISQRLFKQYKSGTNGAINYSNTPKLSHSKIATFGIANLSINSNIGLSDLIPEKVYDSGYSAYVSTPSDIIGFTNAVDVMSLDFTKNSVCKAVAFSTKTLGSVYSHTKTVCDRLRGSEVVSIENFTIQNLTFVRYALKRTNGNIEYSTSFSLGKKAGRNTISFQSHWLTKDYSSEDVMYNFQLWASKPYLVTDMIIELLKKVTAIAPIEAIGTPSVVPTVYITSIARVGANLQVSVKNNTANTSASFSIIKRNNELTDTASINYSFAINPYSTTSFSVKVGDTYEQTINMLVNDTIKDLVYVNDGNWAVNHDTTTTVSNYTVLNAPADTYTTDHPLYRNFHIEASTASYVSVYKMLSGGGATVDLSSFSKLNFTANGGNRLHITILKNAINNWNDQYSFTLPLADSSKAYSISVDSFTSPAFKKSIDLSDVTEIPTGNVTNINSTFSNIGFSSSHDTVVPAPVTDTIAAATVVVPVKAKQQVLVYPNPSNGRFNCTFRAERNEATHLFVINLTTGQKIYTQNYQAQAGLNTVSVDITNSIVLGGVYVITMQTDSEWLFENRMIIRK